MLEPKQAWADSMFLVRQSEKRRLLHSEHILAKLRNQNTSSIQCNVLEDTGSTVAQNFSRGNNDDDVAGENQLNIAAKSIETPASISVQENLPSDSSVIIKGVDMEGSNNDSKRSKDMEILTSNSEKASMWTEPTTQGPRKSLFSDESNAQDTNSSAKQQNLSGDSPVQQDNDEPASVANQLAVGTTTDDPESFSKDEEHIQCTLILSYASPHQNADSQAMQEPAISSNIVSAQLHMAKHTVAGDATSDGLLQEQIKIVPDNHGVKGEDTGNNEPDTEPTTSNRSDAALDASNDVSEQRDLGQAVNVGSADASAAHTCDTRPYDIDSKDQNKRSQQTSSEGQRVQGVHSLHGRSDNVLKGLITKNHETSDVSHATTKRDNIPSSRMQTAEHPGALACSTRQRPAVDNNAARRAKSLDERKRSRDDDQIAIISSNDYICLFCQLEIFSRGYKEAKRRKGYYRRKREKIKEATKVRPSKPA